MSDAPCSSICFPPSNFFTFPLEKYIVGRKPVILLFSSGIIGRKQSEIIVFFITCYRESFLNGSNIFSI